MGNKCSALQRGKKKEEECYKPAQKNEEVLTTVKCEEKSLLLQRVQEEGGAVKQGTEDKTSGRQEEETGCREKNVTLAHDGTVTEVYTPR